MNKQRVIKFNKRCSACDKIATKEIQVIWKGKERFFPRCKNHIIQQIQQYNSNPCFSEILR